MAISKQPLHQVDWVSRDRLHANDYNPNHVAKTELNLLKSSILATGWTQPIVARQTGEIVDGFHRWTVSADPKIAELTEGLVPVVWISENVSVADQMAATIRHNRARGEHGIVPMAKIVGSLMVDYGWTEKQLVQLLGMEREEVQRLSIKSGMPEQSGGPEFGKGWVPE